MTGRILSAIGVTREDLNICFDCGYLPAFSALWWAVTVLSIAGIGVAIFGLYIVICAFV